MRSRLIARLARAFFVVVAVGACYLIGNYQHKLALPSTTANSPPAQSRPPSVATAAPANGEYFSRVQAFHFLLGQIQKTEYLPGESPFERHRDATHRWAYRLDPRMNPADYAFLVEQLAATSFTGEQKSNRQLITAVLVYTLREYNPALAFRLLAPPTEFGWRRDEVTAQVLIALFKQDPAQALAELGQLPSNLAGEHLYRDVYRAWATDPASAREAIASAQALPPGPNRTGALTGIATTWAENFGDLGKNSDRSNIQSAFDWALTLPPEEAAVLDTVLTKAATWAPQIAARYLDRASTPAKRAELIKTIASSWLAVPYRTTLYDPYDANHFKIGHVSLARRPAPDNPLPAILDWVNEVADGKSYSEIVSPLFYGANPEVAAPLLSKITELDVREGATRNVFESWTRKDPAAALAWVQSLPDATPDLRKSALTQWAYHDPVAALAAFRAAPDSPDLLAVAPTIAQALAEDHPAESAALFQSLPESDAKTEALAAPFWQEFERNFEAEGRDAAWAKLAEQPPSTGRDRFMSQQIKDLAEANPAKAAEWAKQLTTESDQAAAAKAIAATWLYQDPQSFAGWAASLPEGPARDAANLQWLGAQAAGQPEQALALAQSLSDPKLRESQVRLVEQAQSVLAMRRGPERDAAVINLARLQAATNKHEAEVWLDSLSSRELRNKQKEIFEQMPDN